MLKADKLQMKINRIYIQSSDSSSDYEMSSNSEETEMSPCVSHFGKDCNVAVVLENNYDDIIFVQDYEQIDEEVNIENNIQRSSESDLESEENGVKQNIMILKNVAEMEQFVIESMRAWASGILSMSKVDDLLGRLSVGFPNMPKSHKTILKSYVPLEISKFGSTGEMWYKSFRINLNQMLN